MQAVLNTAIEDIRQEVEQVLQGNLAQTFIAYVEKSLDASVNHFSNSWMKELISIRQEFEAILKMISLANDN